ncbi:alpha-ketoglutarate-dependent dioxygenase AlkB family protein [Zhihengliuella halotolerans]|uniref:Alkylated DNA repair protein (DNA oxidative demethylase) n=1 Tax=Zhihengliuella halotolerans TaxID=370736 RepID=A0A4Q8AGL4_9MICC|nr:alpha-ketoglutarate-dependent dioxygenase AlkB [Zhihengliuella halotolerans]RZU63520.1 alkylated DNA repair protein (DNA oxidative demethylase) [Zhihengliuella halotolerans]
MPETPALFDADFGGDGPREIVPGAVHVPGWLDLPAQRWVAEQFRSWSAGPVPPRGAMVRGHEMSVRTVCLGWHWQPYRYTREATDVNGHRVLDMPDWMVRMGRRALADVAWSTPWEAGRDVADYTPDTALANFYDENARMGMHQDKDEKSLAPVVSVSVGEACTFRFGNTGNRNRPYQDLTLASGDLFVFGGPARLAYHGVTRILPDTAPAGCGVADGRINITLRETGLDG